MRARVYPSIARLSLADSRTDADAGVDAGVDANVDSATQGTSWTCVSSPSQTPLSMWRSTKVQGRISAILVRRGWSENLMGSPGTMDAMIASTTDPWVTFFLSLSVVGVTSHMVDYPPPARIHPNRSPTTALQRYLVHYGTYPRRTDVPPTDPLASCLYCQSIHRPPASCVREVHSSTSHSASPISESSSLPAAMPHTLPWK